MSRITFDEIMNFYPEHNRSVYDDLKNDCINHKLIPFIGAGLSVFCGYLGWTDVLKKLSKFIYSKEKQEAILTTINSGELLDAAQMIHDDLPRMLIELKKIVDYKKIRDCEISKLSSSAVFLLPYLFDSNMVMTTNYDRVLEEVYDKNCAKFEKVVSPYEPDILTQLRQRNIHCLFKLHGDIGENTISADKLVLTKEQYEIVYNKDGALLQELTEWFKNNKLLFLGCSMTMDKTMEVLRSVSQQNATLDHYAILSCKPEDMSQRIAEIGELGVSAIYYPDGKHDAVRVVLERILEETNYSAYEDLKRNEIMSKSEEKNRFMFDSDFIEFAGREKELSLLEEFCNDNKKILWWAVTGSGGSGKSRLLYEFSKIKKEQGWNIRRLTSDDYHNLENFVPNADNCIVVADDVQAYLQNIGQWIDIVSNRPRSGKLRIVLLERDGKDIDTASWGDILQIESPYSSSIRSNCYKNKFIQLSPLSEDELKSIMVNFAIASEKPLKSEAHASHLLNVLKKVDSEFRRPMYALAIVDAYCAGKDPTSWDKKQVLETLVDRELDFYYKRLKTICEKNISKTAKTELATLLAKSCFGGFIPLDQICENDYPKLCKYADDIGIDFSDLLQQIGIVYTVKIRLIHEQKNSNNNDVKQEACPTFDVVSLQCPDLIKEYLVLRQTFDRKQHNLLLPENWEDDPKQVFFIIRLLSDYPEQLNGKQMFWNAIFDAEPKNDHLAKPICYILNSTILKFSKHAVDALNILKNIYEKFNQNEEIAVQYARALYNAEFSEQIKTCNENSNTIAYLFEQFQNNTELACIYASSLINSIVEQPTEKQIPIVDIVKKLYLQFDESEEMAIQYAKGLFYLSIEQTVDDAMNNANLIKQIYIKYNLNELIAINYAKLLLIIFYKKQSDIDFSLLDDISLLYESFKSNEDIAASYAAMLFACSINLSQTENLEIINKKQELIDAFNSNAEFLGEYSVNLVNLSFYQKSVSEVSETMKESQRLCELFPDNTDFSLCFAETQFNLTLQQSADELEQTVISIRKYLLAHNEINDEFQSALDKYLTKHPENIQKYQQLRV